MVQKIGRKRMSGHVMVLVCVLMSADSIYPAITTAGFHFRSLPKQAAAPATTIRRRAVLQAGSGSNGPMVRVSADGQLLATGTGHGPVRLWDARSGKLITELDGTEGQSPRAFSPVDDRLLASANTKSVSLYDLSSMKLRSYIALDKLLGSLNFFEAFSPDGELFIIDSVGQGKVTLWETKTGRMISSRACSDPLFKSTFSQNGKTVLTSCGDRKTTLWDVQTGNTITEFSSPEKVAVSALSPDGKTVATATLYGHVVLWDAGTGRVKNTWQEHRDLIYFAAFSPDGKLLATASRNGIAIVWDVENLKLKHKLRAPKSGTHLVFSPDSKFLVVLGDGREKEVIVWDVADGSAAFNIGDDDVSNADFSPDGQLLISSSNKTVNVWDVASKIRLTKLTDARLPIHFSQNGKILTTVGPQNTVIIWEVVSQ